MIAWTGNNGTGTSDYRAYSRAHEVVAKDRPTLLGSADPAFLGDSSRWNPEQLLVASVSQCHMLWYLHLAVEAGIVVVEYVDHVLGTMAENPDGSGQFTEVMLRPDVTITDAAKVDEATTLHENAGGKCFITRSVNFPIRYKPVTRVAVGLSV
jgi:organic hydroperoxide reductase OsmC/OhrA